MVLWCTVVWGYYGVLWGCYGVLWVQQGAAGYCMVLLVTAGYYWGVLVAYGGIAAGTGGTGE